MRLMAFHFFLCFLCGENKEWIPEGVEPKAFERRGRWLGAPQRMNKEGSPEARVGGSTSGVLSRAGRLGGNGWRKASWALHPVSVTLTQINEPQDALGVGQSCSGATPK